MGYLWGARQMDAQDSERSAALTLGGAISLGGRCSILWPGTGVFALAWAVAAIALVVAALLIWVALRLKRVGDRLGQTGPLGVRRCPCRGSAVYSGSVGPPNLDRNRGSPSGCSGLFARANARRNGADDLPTMGFTHAVTIMELDRVRPLPRSVAPDFLALTIGIVVFFGGVLITQGGLVPPQLQHPGAGDRRLPRSSGALASL